MKAPKPAGRKKKDSAPAAVPDTKQAALVVEVDAPSAEKTTPPATDVSPRWIETDIDVQDVAPPVELSEDNPATFSGEQTADEDFEASPEGTEASPEGTEASPEGTDRSAEGTDRSAESTAAEPPRGASTGFVNEETRLAHATGATGGEFSLPASNGGSSSSRDAVFQQICQSFDDLDSQTRGAAARLLYDNDAVNRASAFTRALREALPERRRRIGAAIASSGLASEALNHLLGASREKTYEAFSLLFLMAKAGEISPLMQAVEEHPHTETRLAVVKLLALSEQQAVPTAFRQLAAHSALSAEVRTAVTEAIHQLSAQP